MEVNIYSKGVYIMHHSIARTAEIGSEEGQTIFLLWNTKTICWGGDLNTALSIHLDHVSQNETICSSLILS